MRLLKIASEHDRVFRVRKRRDGINLSGTLFRLSCSAAGGVTLFGTKKKGSVF